MKGITYCQELIPKVLDGTKTHTRRRMKPQPPDSIHHFEKWKNDEWIATSRSGKVNIFGKWSNPIKPRYKPGEVVYMKEPWRIYSWHEGEPLRIQYKDGTTMEDRSDGLDDKYEEWYEKIVLQCGDDFEKAGIKCNEDGIYQLKNDDELPTRWRSPMFMPKICSRQNLLIKSATPERIQDISASDIIKEGCPKEYNRHPKNWFLPLWNSLHPGSWEKNDWEWKYEIGRV